MLDWLKRLLVPFETRPPGSQPLVSDLSTPRGPRPRGARVQREEPWDPHAVELYRTLVRTRLGEHACRACGGSLEAASLSGVDGGTTLDEYRLSDAAAARLLALTQRLSVTCEQCGARAEI